MNFYNLFSSQGKGGFYHFSQILKKNFFLALFYAFMHVVVIFKV